MWELDPVTSQRTSAGRPQACLSGTPPEACHRLANQVSHHLIPLQHRPAPALIKIINKISAIHKNTEFHHRKKNYLWANINSKQIKTGKLMTAGTHTGKKKQFNIEYYQSNSNTRIKSSETRHHHNSNTNRKSHKLPSGETWNCGLHIRGFHVQKASWRDSNLAVHWLLK